MECGLRLRRHAPGLGGKRLAETSLARRAGAFEADRVAVGGDGVAATVKPHIDRCQHIPAAAVVRIGGQMRLGTRHQVFDRTAGSVDTRAVSGCDGRLGEPSSEYMPQLTSGTARIAAAVSARDRRGTGWGAVSALSAPPLRRMRRPISGLRLLCFAGADQSARGVAAYFGQLVAIDGDVVGSGRRSRSCAHGRQNDCHACAECEEGRCDPESHGILNTGCVPRCQFASRAAY